MRGPIIADDRNLHRVFQEMFCVQDIAAALLSFDDTANSELVKSVMEAKGLEVVGIRQNGFIAGYVEQSDLRNGCCREVMRPLDIAQVVPDGYAIHGAAALLYKHSELGDAQSAVQRYLGPYAALFEFAVCSKNKGAT